MIPLGRLFKTQFDTWPLELICVGWDLTISAIVFKFYGIIYPKFAFSAPKSANSKISNQIWHLTFDPVKWSRWGQNSKLVPYSNSAPQFTLKTHFSAPKSANSKISTIWPLTPHSSGQRSNFDTKTNSDPTLNHVDVKSTIRLKFGPLLFSINSGQNCI